MEDEAAAAAKKEEVEEAAAGADGVGEGAERDDCESSCREASCEKVAEEWATAPDAGCGLLALSSSLSGAERRNRLVVLAVLAEAAAAVAVDSNDSARS